MKAKWNSSKFGYAVIGLLVLYAAFEILFYVYDEYHTQWNNDPDAKAVVPLEGGIHVVLLRDYAGRALLEKRDRNGDRIWTASAGDNFYDKYGSYTTVNQFHLFVDGDTLYLYKPGDKKDAYLKYDFQNGDTKGGFPAPKGCPTAWFHSLFDGNTIYHPTAVPGDSSVSECKISAIDKNNGKIKWTGDTIDYAFLTPMQNDDYIFFPHYRGPEPGVILVEKRTGRTTQIPKNIFGTLREDALYTVSEAIVQPDAVKTSAEAKTVDEADKLDAAKNAVGEASAKKKEASADNVDESKKAPRKIYRLNRVDLPSKESRAVASFPKEALFFAKDSLTRQPPVFWHLDNALVFEQQESGIVLTAYSMKDGKRQWSFKLPEGFEPYMGGYSWVRNGDPDAYPYLDAPFRFLPMVLKQRSDKSFFVRSGYARLAIAVFDLNSGKLSFQSRPFVADRSQTDEDFEFHAFLKEDTYHFILHVGGSSRNAYHFLMNGNTGKFQTPYRLVKIRDGVPAPFYMVDTRQFLPSQAKQGIHYLINYMGNTPRKAVRLDFAAGKVLDNDELRLIPMPRRMRQSLSLNKEEL